MVEQFTVTLTIEDPCTSPTIIAPDCEPTEYTITDEDLVYEMSPKFSATPSYCPLEIVFEPASEIEDLIEFNAEEQSFTVA